MKADAAATFGPFLNSVLIADRALPITIKKGDKVTIESSTYDSPTLRYWVIIYKAEESQQEYIRYLVNISSVELNIGNSEDDDLNLLLTHWKETAPGVIVQCDLTSNSY